MDAVKVAAESGNHLSDLISRLLVILAVPGNDHMKQTGRGQVAAQGDEEEEEQRESPMLEPPHDKVGH